MAEEFNTGDMLSVYLFENQQLLENLQNMVMDQKDADGFDEDSINEIFRIMHTIKGSSGIMMFDEITKVAHKLEDVFYYLRESRPDNVPHNRRVRQYHSLRRQSHSVQLLRPQIPQHLRHPRLQKEPQSLRAQFRPHPLRRIAYPLRGLYGRHSPARSGL